MSSSGDCRVFYISSCKFYRLRAVDIVFLVLHTSIAQVLRKNNYENRQTLRRGLISVRLQQRAEHKSSNWLQWLCFNSWNWQISPFSWLTRFWLLILWFSTQTPCLFWLLPCLHATSYATHIIQQFLLDNSTATLTVDRVHNREERIMRISLSSLASLPMYASNK